MRYFSAKPSDAAAASEDEENTESKKQKEENSEYYEEELPEDTKEFKWYRRLFFLIGKTIKYTTWLMMALFAYHMVLIKKYKAPELKFPTVELFLRAARHVDYTIFDIKKIFTQPAMSKMLPDMPPGMQSQKTLVLGLKGTLVH